jgi:hypothetical protein
MCRRCKPASVPLKASFYWALDVEATFYLIFVVAKGHNWPYDEATKMLTPVKAETGKYVCK